MTTSPPASPILPSHLGTGFLPYGYSGRCSHCRHVTEASWPGEVACKWGRCNGTVNAQRKRESS